MGPGGEGVEQHRQCCHRRRRVMVVRVVPPGVHAERSSRELVLHAAMYFSAICFGRRRSEADGLASCPKLPSWHVTHVHRTQRRRKVNITGRLAAGQITQSRHARTPQLIRSLFALVMHVRTRGCSGSRPPPQAAVARPRRLARHRTVCHFAVAAHQMKIIVASVPHATPNSYSMFM